MSILVFTLAMMPATPSWPRSARRAVDSACMRLPDRRADRPIDIEQLGQHGIGAHRSVGLDHQVRGEHARSSARELLPGRVESRMGQQAGTAEGTDPQTH